MLWGHLLVIVLSSLLALAGVGFAQFDRGDEDADGYADGLELHATSERQAFKDWFAAIAESQFVAISPDWLPEYQDCSGLLRYAFTQALSAKNALWFEKFAYLRVQTPPVRNLTYPMPEVSRSVFRVANGSYQADDVSQGRLVGVANSEALMNHATVALGRTLQGYAGQRVERGDLLFFVHPLAEGSAYHSMIYLGNGYVIYHTGATPEEGGEVRLLSLATLNRHPDPTWHPVPENPYFLGFFRWKIVD